MNCVSPLDITVKRFSSYSWKEHYKVPCGNCINCLIRKQSALEFLAKKELLDVYKNGLGASFVTLTYDDSHIPCNDKGFTTLRKKDVQLFYKNMRRQMEYHNCKTPFKYIMCGEYGDSFGRPHYHIVFLGLSDVLVQKFTKKLWKHGLCDIGPLSAGGLRYVCKYMTKQHPSKDIKIMREKFGVENPFICHSFGLGKKWIQTHVNEIVENDFQFSINGKVNFYPSYICRYVSLRTGVSYKKIITSKLAKTVFDFSRRGISYKDYTAEQTYLRYQQNIASLRSKGITVSAVDLDKIHWVKPRHKFDRQLRKQYSDLASLADSIAIPF